PIKRVVNPRDTVVTVRNVVGDPTTVLLTGQTADTTTIELTDEGDTTEKYEVIVQRDIENLRTQLRRAVPTANLMPTPIGDVDVIIGGTVQRADDIEVIVRVAASLGFRVIPAMRIGGVQQVQLDVVVAAVTRSEIRQLGVDWEVGSKNFQF